MPDTLPDLLFLARLLDVDKPYPFSPFEERNLWLHVGYERSNPVKNARARRRLSALLNALPFRDGLPADAFTPPVLTRAAIQFERWESHNHTFVVRRDEHPVGPECDIPF